MLLTFVFFFIFTGNIGRIPAVSQGLSQLISGREFLSGIAVSQVISNVPATMLMTSFTKDLGVLLTGVNVGGLGTLIASMASLISFKYFMKQGKGEGLKYVKTFTLFNLGFLVLLVCTYLMLKAV